MFTGLVQAIGTVTSLVRGGESARLTARAVLEDGPLVAGESIAVDGICLTVARVRPTGFEADLSAETLARTTAGSWLRGRRVNLERALTLASRLGGHFVQGHVDGRARVLAISRGRGQTTLRVGMPADQRHLIAMKGSIAVDGVSLTVAALGRGWFEAALIPHTLAATNLSNRRAGDAVNLEVDLLARYLERLLEAPKTGAGRASRTPTGGAGGGRRHAGRRQ